MDKQSALETLIRCVVRGQSQGVFSIKDSSAMYDIILHLRGTKVNETFEENACFSSLVRAVILSHSKGVYSLEESSVIDKTIQFLADEGLVVLDEPQPKKLETIEEEEVVEV